MCHWLSGLCVIIDYMQIDLHQIQLIIHNQHQIYECTANYPPRTHKSNLIRISVSLTMCSQCCQRNPPSNYEHSRRKMALQSPSGMAPSRLQLQVNYTFVLFLDYCAIAHYYTHRHYAHQ